MKFGPMNAEISSASCNLSIFVDGPAQSIDPHDPRVRCWSGQWDSRRAPAFCRNVWFIRG
jgi:hypothetical protein